MRTMSKYTICPVSTIQYACVIIMHSAGDRRRNWPSTLFSIVRILIKSAIWRIGFEPRMSGKAIHLLLIASTGIYQLILIHVKFPSVINTYSNLPYFRPLNRGLSWMLPNQQKQKNISETFQVFQKTTQMALFLELLDHTWRMFKFIHDWQKNVGLSLVLEKLKHYELPP